MQKTELLETLKANLNDLLKLQNPNAHSLLSDAITHTRDDFPLAASFIEKHLLHSLNNNPSPDYLYLFNKAVIYIDQSNSDEEIITLLEDLNRFLSFINLVAYTRASMQERFVQRPQLAEQNFRLNTQTNFLALSKLIIEITSCERKNAYQLLALLNLLVAEQPQWTSFIADVVVPAWIMGLEFPAKLGLEYMARLYTDHHSGLKPFIDFLQRNKDVALPIPSLENSNPVDFLADEIRVKIDPYYLTSLGKIFENIPLTHSDDDRQNLIDIIFEMVFSKTIYCYLSNHTRLAGQASPIIEFVLTLSEKIRIHTEFFSTDKNPLELTELETSAKEAISNAINNFQANNLNYSLSRMLLQIRAVERYIKDRDALISHLQFLLSGENEQACIEYIYQNNIPSSLVRIIRFFEDLTSSLRDHFDLKDEAVISLLGAEATIEEENASMDYITEYVDGYLTRYPDRQPFELLEGLQNFTACLFTKSQHPSDSEQTRLATTSTDDMVSASTSTLSTSSQSLFAHKRRCSFPGDTAQHVKIHPL